MRWFTSRRIQMPDSKHCAVSECTFEERQRQPTKNKKKKIWNRVIYECYALFAPIYHYVRKSDAWLLWCDHMQRFRIWSFASETERDGGPRRPVTSFIFVALVSVLSSSSWLLIFNVGRASNRLVHRSSTVNWAIHFLSTCLIARALKGKSKWSTVAL